MPNNPLLPADILNYYQWSAQNGINPPQLPAGYVLATDPTTTGILALRLFDAAYITTGIIDPNRLGTGATGAGNLYLADDGTWKPVAGGGGGGDMYKATYDTDNSGIVDKAEALTTLGRNSTGATLYEGTIVRIEGSTGNRPNFVKAQANNDANSAQTFGVVMTDIANNSDGYVLVQGTLHDLDTRTGAGGATHPFTDVTLADGDLLFLHPTIAGYVTNIKPSAPQHLVYVGVVTRTSPTNGTIVYRVQNGYELYELHDVAPTPYINNGVLYRDTATNLWKSATIATILGGTPLLSVPTLAQVTTAGNTTTNAITVGGLTSNGNVNVGGNFVGNILSNQYVHFTGGGTGEYRFVNGAGGGWFFTWCQNSGSAIPPAERMRLSSNNNLLIGTATDSGYRLDVNGTARIVNKTNIGSETVSQGSLYIGHNGTAGGSNGTSTVFFVSQFGNYPYRLGAEGNGYDFYLRQANGGQGSINIDFSGLNSISYNITNTNVLNQSFGKSVVIDAKMSLNSYLAIGTRFGYSDSVTAGDSPLIFFRSMSGSYFDKTLDAAVTIRNGLPTVADNNITKNTAYWYRNGYIGIGTSTTFSATNTLKGAITINQGTTIGYQNLTPGSLSSVITSGTSTTVTFTPNNGNGVPGYDIIVGTIITANGVSRRVTAVNYQSVTVDSAVDWSAGYNYTYRNPYVSIADGSTPIFDILPSGNVAVGTTTGLAKFTVAGSITAASLIAQGVYFNNTLVAAANNDVLVGLDINPTFTNGAFTGVANAALRVQGWNWATTGVTIGPIGVAWDTSTGPVNGFTLDRSGVYGRFRIGSGSGFGYQFFTNSTERLRIVDGNVMVLNTNMLVGTTTDAGYKLDVNGTARFNGNISGLNGLSITSGNIISQTGANSGRMTMLNLRNTGGGFQSAVGTSLAIAFTNREVAGVWSDDVIENVVYSNTAGAVTTGYSFYTHSNQLYNASPVLAMSINGTNVGIGTATPTAKLQIKGTGDSSVWITTDDFNSGTNTGSVIRIGTRNSTGNTAGWIDALNNGYSSYANLMLSAFGGNVLIGTTTDAGYKLDVNGSVNIGSSSFSFASNLVTLTSSAGTSSLRIGGGNTLYVSGALTAANLAATDYVWVVRVLVGNGLARLTATTTDWLSITDSGQTSNGSGNLSAKFATFGTTYATINASAQVEIASIVKGFLQPRMTNAQAVAITSPATGLQLYDTTNNKNLLYNGTAWQNIATESWIAGQGYITSQPWVVSGSDIYYTTGRVGIGTTSPTDILHIVSGAAANIFGRISSTSANGTAAWVAQNDQVDNVVYRVFGSGVTGTQMGVNLARSASLIANLDGTGKFLIGTYSNTDVVFGAGDQERMRLINNTGNFLIGTTVDVGTKLNVSGDINAMGYRINNVIGYTGILNIPGNPPGMQNVDIQGGIIVNIF